MLSLVISILIVLFLIWLVKSLFWSIVIIVVACFALWLYRKALGGRR